MKIVYTIGAFLSVMFCVVACGPAVSKRDCREDNVGKDKSDSELAVLFSPVCARYPGEDIDMPYSLPGSEEFRVLLDNPCEYKAALIRVIKNSSSRRAEKLIAVYCLQQLCVDDYLEVLCLVINEFRNNRVDESFVLSAIIQDGFSVEVAKKYETPRLQEYLKALLPLISKKENQVIIRDFLSGKAWQYLNKRHGGKEPWRCI